MKKLMTGLLVAATAVGVSAFTNAKNVKTSTGQLKARMITSDFLVNKGANNAQQRSEVDVASGCGTSDSRNCVYDVTASGKLNIPDQATYSDSQITSFQSNGWIEADPDSHEALYAD